MSIKPLSMRGSPYVGVFCSVTDEIALVPSFLEKKDEKKIADTLSVETIVTSLADSHLLGAMARGIGKKFAVASTVSNEEKDFLKGIGVHIHTVHGITAVGNLLAVQHKHGIVSPLVPHAVVQDLEKFFGIPLLPRMVAQSELAGACVLATEKGFLAHPKTAPEQMEEFEEKFGVPGMTTTANYGDPFVGNSILANKHGIVVGERTSGPELQRIEEGLHPYLLNQQKL